MCLSHQRETLVRVRTSDRIRNPIYGNIPVSDSEKRLIDTEVMQRLRRVRQVSLSSLVFPGATHTQFSHSLGVMYLAGELADSLATSDRAYRTVRIAGLLHDIGHGPFSHASGDIAESFGRTHEERSCELIRDELADIMVKLFERVAGGTITGQTNATNGTATAVLELETGTDRPFEYRQSVPVEDGSFELTVPYPTDEMFGPEDGYANASVRMAEDAGGYSVFVQDQNGSIESTENVTVSEETIQTGGVIEVNPEPFEINNGGDDSESDDSSSDDSSDNDDQNNIVGAPTTDE